MSELTVSINHELVTVRHGWTAPPGLPQPRTQTPLTKPQRFPMAKMVHGLDVRHFPHHPADHELFARRLRSFVPHDAFDVHAHLYDLSHLAPNTTTDDNPTQPTQIGHHVFTETMQKWMGDRLIRDGLFFPMPVRDLDCQAANQFLAHTLNEHPGSRGLMMIRPHDVPEDVEAEVARQGFAGFKVYHVFADREDTFNAEQSEFLPEWAWQIADRHALAIMMHMVLPRALSDPRNQSYIQKYCRRYPNAKLILAHAARGFNSAHTVEGIHSIRGLENVWFDTSVVCEPSALESIIDSFGVTRLMYGSDFPVSEMRGRSLSVGDGFYWIYDHNAEWKNWQHAQPELVGIESLLALQQACRRMKLIDRDVERIFGDNARNLLGLNSPADPVANKSNVQSQYQAAKQIIPGGTQLLSKRPEMFAPQQWPAYFEQAIGCEVVDTDGKRYIDMSHCGILSCILGFADPEVNAAVIRRVQLGNMSTQQTQDEVTLAQLLIEIHPWAQQARFTRSGGEAMAVATRIARAKTGKSRLAVCGYHGWHDWYLAANLAPASDSYQLDAHLLAGLEATGVPQELGGTVATFRYNQIEDFEAAIARCGDDLAGIVMEPTRSVDPQPGFLETIRRHADKRQVPLIFDEISSAWRLCLGGAHRQYDVEPDLAVFAKAMSNGFAMGAIIGREPIMQACQESFISSTYWTEGIGPAAAVASIRKMMRVDVPAHLLQLGTIVQDGWRRLGSKHNLPLVVGGRPASCNMNFDHPDSAALLTLMTTRMLDLGFLAAGSCSLTLAHEPHHVERYLEALDVVFGELAGAIRSGNVASHLRGPIKHATFQRLTD